MSRVVALLLSSATAFRLVKNRDPAEGQVQEPPPGKVDELFTLGAPGTFKSAPSLECMPGLRIINAWGRREWWAPSTIDIVPSMTGSVGLRHFMMDVGQVDLRYGNFSLTPCSNETARDPSNGTSSIGIHFPAKYEDGARYLPSRAAKMTRFARVAYKDKTSTVVKGISDFGYGLVATVTAITDWKQISHLLQSPETLECILTFHGTESAADWITNFQASFTDFCGLSTQVHWGFRKQFRRIVQNPGFQSDVRPNLPFCKTLTVVGHSMGGAIGELLAACLQRAPREGESGWEDYQYIGFELHTAHELMYK